jgi:tetratricopeptide (TPR) repeat protein
VGLFVLSTRLAPAADGEETSDAKEPRVTAKEAEILRRVETLAETDIQAAIGQLRMGLAADVNPAMLYALGVLHLRNDQMALAEVAFAEAVQRQPGFLRARRNLANVLAAQNKLDAAQRELRTVLRQAPDLAAARVTLGGILLEQDKTDEAMAEMRGVLAAAPDNVQARVILAGACMNKQAWVEAEGHLEAAIAQRPGDVQSLRNLAAVLLEQEKWAEAVPRLESLLERDAGANDIRGNLIYALAEQGRHKDAQPHVLALAKAPNADLSPVNLLVQAHLDANHRDEAVALLRDVLSLRPDALELRELLAGLLLTGGETASGVRELRVIIDREPNRVSARRALVDALLQSKAYEAVIPELRRLLDMAVEDKGQLWARIGDTHRLLGRHASAATAYRNALEYAPQDADLRMSLIRSVLDQGDLDQAAQLARDELAHDPSQGDLWRLLANIALRQAKAEDALAWLDCAREFGSADAESLITQGDLLLKDGLFVEALERYRESTQKENVPADRLIRAVEGFLTLGRPDEAKALAEEVNRREGNLAPEQRRRLQTCNARITELRGNAETALAAYQGILKDAPLDGAVLMAAADLLRRRGSFGEALEYYERAARVSAEHEPLSLVRQAQIAVERREFEQAAYLLERSLALHHQDYVARYLAQVQRLSD